MHDEYWTMDEVNACNEARTLEELTRPAFTILQRMRDGARGHISMVLGPMTTGGFGSRQINMVVFRHSIIVAKERGRIIFDQTHFQDAMIRIGDIQGIPKKEYRQDILELFYLPLFKTRNVGEGLFLPRWDSSRGTNWERKTVPTCQIAIAEYPFEWYREVLNRVSRLLTHKQPVQLA